MSQTVIEIRLRKISKTYYENENIAGVVFIETKQDLNHQGIILTLNGIISLEISGKTIGKFEALYNSVKPINLIQTSLELQKSGKLPHGTVEIPFEIPLKLMAGSSTGIKRLFETYRGVFINIGYTLSLEVKKSMLQKSLTHQCDILVQYKEPISNDERAQIKPIKFEINPNNVTNVKDTSQLPHFSIVGRLDSTEIALHKPLTGFITVESCDRPIKSIEIQLVRVEICGCAEGYSKESTEIENLQMGDGDVGHNVEIPIYLLLPRIFTCPTTASVNFKINFEVNIVILFEDNHLVIETLPLKITRF